MKSKEFISKMTKNVNLLICFKKSLKLVIFCFAIRLERSIIFTRYSIYSNYYYIWNKFVIIISDIEEK